MATQLKGFGTLFSETWNQYKARAIPVLGVILLTTLLVIIAMTIVGILLALLIGGIRPFMGELQTGHVNMSMMVILPLFFVLVSILVLWSQSATL